MKKLAWTLTLMAALPFALSAQVTKEDLKKLAAAGISDEVIVSYVRSNGPVVKLSAEDVIELKQAGASEKVLAAALGNLPPAAPAYQPSYDQPAAPRQTYTTSTPYVVDSTPYYYQPSVSYASYVETPYYYPSYGYGYYGGYYGGACYPRSYGSCYPRYYGNSCSGYGYGVGYSNGRGYIGVSGYRGGVSVGVGYSSGSRGYGGGYTSSHASVGGSVGGYRGGHR